MSSTVGVKRQVSRSGLSESTDAKLDASMTLPAIADRPLSIMQVNVVLKEPEIVLIEDLSVSDSRVLVVKTAATFKMTVTPDETVRCHPAFHSVSDIIIQLVVGLICV